jgi:hypothetical protein
MKIRITKNMNAVGEKEGKVVPIGEYHLINALQIPSMVEGYLFIYPAKFENIFVSEMIFHLFTKCGIIKILGERSEKMTKENQENIPKWEATDDLSSLFNKPKIIPGVISYVPGIKSDPALVAGVANESPHPGKKPFF